ncbi:MAG: hypothetical protein IJA66_07995 [Alistipes sp.]|nr:hypothetical protein [Alistipes sp.]
MKKILLRLTTSFFAVFIVLLSSCSKEQTSLSIEDIEGRAKVIGSYYYDAGQSYENGKYVQMIKPVAGVTVHALVSNASLSPDGNSSGYTTYSTKTDKDGKFEIKVPVVSKGTSVIIRSTPFQGIHTTVVDVSNNRPVFDEQNVVYAAADTNLTLKPNDVKFVDSKFVKDSEQNIETGFPYHSTCVVKVGEATYNKVNVNNIYQIEKAYEEASGVDVLIHIEQNGTMYTYGATTNSKGEATFVIPSKEQRWSTSVTIEVNPYLKTNYIYYKSEGDTINQYRISSGTYSMFSGSYFVDSVTTSAEFSDLPSAPAPVLKVRMVFEPFEGEDVYGYSYYDWRNVSF